MKQVKQRAPRGWTFKAIADTTASELSATEHRAQIASASFGVFDELLAKHAARHARKANRAKALAAVVPFKKADANVQLDNLAVPSHPVWRRRLRKPFSCRAIRMELARQAAQQSGTEQVVYLRRRLTALDKALADDEADALERWLDCEEILSGRVKIGDYGDRTGGGSGKASPVPDDWLRSLREHAALKRRMAAQHLDVLKALAQMMEAPQWDYADAGAALFGLGRCELAKKRFIREVCDAAAILAHWGGC